MTDDITEFKKVQVSSSNDPEKLEIVTGNIHQTYYSKYSCL
jgi:hypothetical protein